MTIETGDPGSTSLTWHGPIPEHAPFFLHAFEFAPLIITIHEGPEHIVRYANAAARSTAARREYADLPLVAVFPELAEWGVLARFDRAYDSRKTVRSGIYRMREIGSLQPRDHFYEQTIVPRFDAAGEITGVTAFTNRLGDEGPSHATN